jgi:hypothetical protein
MIFLIFISFNNSLFGQTKSDTLLIEETVLNYLEGLHDNNAINNRFMRRNESNENSIPE